MAKGAKKESEKPESNRTSKPAGAQPDGRLNVAPWVQPNGSSQMVAPISGHPHIRGDVVPLIVKVYSWVTLMFARTLQLAYFCDSFL